MAAGIEICYADLYFVVVFRYLIGGSRIQMYLVEVLVVCL